MGGYVARGARTVVAGGARAAVVRRRRANGGGAGRGRARLGRAAVVGAVTPKKEDENFGSSVGAPITGIKPSQKF